MSNLVHIVKVEFASGTSLSNLKVTSPSSCRILSAVNFSEILIEGLAEVNVEDAYENNQTVYSTTLSFQSHDRKLFGLRQAAFRLSSADGHRYMLGTHTRPYPIIKETVPFPDKPGDSTLKKVTVTWKSPLPMLLLEE